MCRGPFGDFSYSRNAGLDHLVMICQGTGIVPLFSVIEQILEDENDEVKLHLMYCCKDPSEVICTEKLVEFCSFWNFKLQIFLENGNTRMVSIPQREVLYRKMQKPDVRHEVDSRRGFKSSIVVCG